MSKSELSKLYLNVYTLNAQIECCESSYKQADLIKQLTPSLKELQRLKKEYGIKSSHIVTSINNDAEGIYHIKGGKIKGSVNELKRELHKLEETLDFEKPSLALEKYFALLSYLNNYEKSKENQKPQTFIDLSEDGWVS